MKSPLQYLQYSFLWLFCIILYIPLSVSKDDYRYSNCKQTFDCGDIQDIPYPFWGGNRPNYCGRPGFELVCPEDGTSEINIASQTYRVLKISQVDEILRIARKDLWDPDCKMHYRDTSLDLTLFQYVLTRDLNLTLFYNCPSSTPKVLMCNTNGAVSRYQVGFPSLGTENGLFSQCKDNAVITVLEESVMQRGVHDIDKRTKEAVELVLRDGFEVGYDGNIEYHDLCVGSGGQYGYNWTLSHHRCFCPGGDYQTKCPKGTARKKVIAAIIAAGTFAALMTVATILIWCRLRKKSNGSIILWKKKSRNGRGVEAFFKDCEFLAPRRFKYKDIKRMTNSFNDKVGQGGFGSVFKGKLPDGHMVAVKVLNGTKGDGIDFINEVASISRTSHVNIVTLLGFCIDGPKRALIYEFMPNGSLEKFIYGERSLQTRHLGWEALYKVAIGIARGLEYLHRGCNTRIVHFDIKPHNILLDENFIPKIADFGLSKLSNVAQSVVSMTGARGTPGYIAPELVSRSIGEVSHKSDVYSYGMMVLEMVGGRKNVDVRVTNLSKIYFPPWIHKRLELNEDLGLHGVTSLEGHEIARKMILVGLWCIQINPTCRPPMCKVLEMLEGRLEALQLPPKPYLSSPSTEDESSALSISTMSDVIM